MAPSFFAKLVKPNNNSAGDGRPRTSSESFISAAVDPSYTRARTLSSRPPNGAGQGEGDPKSTSSPRGVPAMAMGANGEGSPGPSFTIIPPSPSSSTGLSFSTDPGAAGQPGDVQRKRSRSSLPHVDPETATGAAVEGSKPSSDTTQDRHTTHTVATPSLSSTPSISNLKSLPQPAGTQQQQAMLSASPKLSAKLLSHKSSSKSIRPQTQAPPNPSNHARAATTPAPSTAPPPPPIPLPQVISASPEELRPSVLIESPGIENPPFALPPPASFSQNALYSGIPPSPSTHLTARSDTDAASVISTSKKKKPWGRASPPRKHSGLAGAIAASGLAMANPSMQVPAQLSPTSKDKNKDKDKDKKAKEKPKGGKEVAGTRKASNASARTRPTLSRPTARTHHSAGSLELARSRTSLEDGESVDSRSLSGSDRSDDDDDDEMDLDLGEDDIPVTGFAVASSKRNADFHDLFKTIPEGDYLIEDYGCAIQREILIQGRLYISENHICFHANIFGWITDLSIPIYEITALEKKMTALIIPNAIQITTRQAKYTFASFLSRDTTFDVIYNIWRLAKPQDSTAFEQMVDGDSGGSFDGVSRLGTESIMSGSVGIGVANGMMQNKVTQCACSKGGTHFTETAMESVLPGTPDRIHNLIFASGFIKDFMREDQKLLDIQISDWTPTSADSKLLTRNMSYIKPLTASLGPKQAKCELTDEVVYCDFDDYVSTITTTRTPDVPSGGVFSVKTRTCITWASSVSSRVVVTTQVEWTGRSFIKSIIEKSAIDGQKTYHSELDNAMRAYIRQHQSEFVPEGVDPAAVAAAAPDPDTPALDAQASSKGKPSALSESERERERNRRGLQWAWDTFEGAYQVAHRSTTGALELIRDAWDQSTSTTILYFVIVLLVLSNLWTLMRMGTREEAGRRKEMRRMEEREQWVQGVVKGLWEEMNAGKMGYPVGTLGPVNTGGGDLRDEIAGIQKTLDLVEARVQSIRETLALLD